MRRTFSKVTTLDFNKANFRWLSELVTGVLFHECWSVFKNQLLKTQEQVISLLEVKQAMEKTSLIEQGTPLEMTALCFKWESCSLIALYPSCIVTPKTAHPTWGEIALVQSRVGQSLPLTNSWCIFKTEPIINSKLVKELEGVSCGKWWKNLCFSGLGKRRLLSASS